MSMLHLGFSKASSLPWVGRLDLPLFAEGAIYKLCFLPPRTAFGSQVDCYLYQAWDDSGRLRWVWLVRAPNGRLLAVGPRPYTSLRRCEGALIKWLQVEYLTLELCWFCYRSAS